jgi:hypothetical protein
MKFSSKSKIVFLSACFVFAALAQAWAADVTGKWTAQVPGRGGQTRETTFNLKAEGDKLTGTVSGMQGDNPISDGKISGDDISFKVKVSFNGNDFAMVYKGKVAGDEIKFTRTIEGRDAPPTEFTAKRAK